MPDGKASTATSLQKLTVPQLKALCKEQKITGYSKLGKAALIEKLVPTQGSAEGAQNVAANVAEQTQLAARLSRAAESLNACTKASTARSERPGDPDGAHIARTQVLQNESGPTKDGMSPLGALRTSSPFSGNALL